MFFESESVSFRILEVWELKQRNVRLMNRGRRFSALSFRLASDAVLKTAEGEYPMEKGSISFVPAGVDYLRCAETDEMIVVDFELLGGAYDAIESFVPQNGYLIEKLFRELLSSWKKRAAGYPLKCASLFYAILAECYAENCAKKLPVSRIGASLDYMRENYADPDLTVAKIAARSFMSEVYFRRLFKVEMGISPIKYLISLRIGAAADLMERGYHSLQEIARLSGFSDYKYFSVEFKKLRGVSPSKYSGRRA